MRLIREEKDFIRDAILLMLPMILQNFVTFSMSMADTFMPLCTPKIISCMT